MYPDLYKELNLKLEDLEMCDSLLMGFDGRMRVREVARGYAYMRGPRRFSLTSS